MTDLPTNGKEGSEGNYTSNKRLKAYRYSLDIHRFVNDKNMLALHVKMITDYIIKYFLSLVDSFQPACCAVLQSSVFDFFP